MTWFRAGVIVALLSVGAFAQDRRAAKGADKPGREQLEQRFTEQMRNVVLVGHFTMDGQESKDLKEERYEIDSVVKGEGDEWTFNVRIKYGKTDVKLPLPLDVVWAGDTPMVTLTDYEIPLIGGGAFTSRVIFYEGRYAGTWQHGKVGGHLFGKIVKAEEGKEAIAPDSKE